MLPESELPVSLHPQALIRLREVALRAASGLAPEPGQVPADRVEKLVVVSADFDGGAAAAVAPHPSSASAVASAAAVADAAASTPPPAAALRTSAGPRLCC